MDREAEQDTRGSRWILRDREGAWGPTHVPGADEDGDHVRLWLLGVLVLHLLQQLAETFSLLGMEGQTD